MSYPATPILSVDAVQDRFVVVEVVPVAAKLVGAVGALVSGNVVAVAVVLAAEIFPAASLALTVKT